MPDKQSFAHWVRDHAITANALNPQAALDDLEPLRALIGDARVVALGESAHYVREFYLLRHRLLRFLAERCGFTVYALEAPFTAAHAIDAWVQGGLGSVAEVATAGVAIDLGRCREMHDLLRWMRAHNRSAAAALRFTGTDVPGSGGSPLPALEAVAAYLRQYDPDALPLLEEEHRAAARLALLTALASYQVDAGVVEGFRSHCPDDAQLIAATAWASFTAARRVGTWL